MKRPARVPERVDEVLSRLVAWPTVSSRPLDEMAAWLAQRAEDVGFDVSIQRNAPGKCNIVARRGPSGTDGLVISGHMDVVPTDGQSWSSDPFRLTEREGLLFGRGTADMKGFIAAVDRALLTAAAQRFERELVLIWTHDEEIGCHGSRLLVDQMRTDDVHLPSQTLIGEPTGFKVCHLHPGHCTYEVRCVGRAAHSSRPDLGLSAIGLAGRALSELDQLAAEWRRQTAHVHKLPTPWTVLNVGSICGGTAVNIIPEQCTLLLGIRPLPGQPLPEIESALRAAVQRVNRYARPLGGSVELVTLQQTPALESPPDSALCQTLLPMSDSAAPTGAPFATDGGNLALLGTAPIVFGPGSIDVAHRADEHISATDLHRAVGAVEAVIRTHCVLPLRG